MILVCGEALIDFFPSAPDAPHGLSFTGVAGGSPFNVAVGLARLGRRSGFLSALSTDAFGRHLAGRLEAEGVELGHVRRTARPTTVSFVATRTDGSPDYVFLGDGAADRGLSPGDLPARLDPAVRALHFGSFSLAVEPAATAYETLLLREAGARVVALDPNVRARLVPDMAAFRSRFEGLVRHAHLVKASTEDLGHLYPGLAAAAAAARWRGLGARLVLVTDGPNGALAVSGAARAERPGRPVSVLDTVGAGDSFQAAVLAVLDRQGLLAPGSLDALDGDRLAGLLDTAIEAASITCGRRGADLPRAGELASLA